MIGSVKDLADHVNIDKLWHGKCILHEDDNFNGKIDYSKIMGGQNFEQNDCVGQICFYARITNCHYTIDGICQYQLSWPNLVHERIDCVITNKGI